MIIKLISFIEIDRKEIQNIITELKKIERVVRIKMISGKADLLIEIQGEEGNEIVNSIEKIEKIRGITEIHSHFVMDEWKK